jgi:hypothetical protein
MIMKNQYFGDVNDFRKYGLLRLLTIQDRLRLGVCWMLTEPDGRRDGEHRSYLSKPAEYRHRDPDLFDWLKRAVNKTQHLRTTRLEASGLLGQTTFQSAGLTDNLSQRSEYFRECAALFAGCDLVFFDPDNGMEVQSVRPGRKNSCKYLWWDEVDSTFTAGSSVLIYQHFPRKPRAAFIARMTENLRQRTRAATAFVYRTPYVLFLLASQRKHVVGFRRQLAAVFERWGPKEIIAVEHSSIRRTGGP